MIAAFDSHVAADSVTFVGSPIALRNCRIQAIQGGHLVFINPSGQRQQRSLDDVNALSFEGWASLDKAEKLIAGGDLDAGVRALMAASLDAEGDMQRAWVCARLARIHDARGEFVQAAGHAATVMAMTDDPYWRKLEPVSEPNAASLAAAEEAFDALQAAAKSVRSTSLKASVDRMLKVVRPLRDRLATEYGGPPIEPGSTVSGVLKSELVKSSADAPASSAAQPTEANKSQSPPLPTSEPVSAPIKLEPVAPSSPQDLNSPAAIDALLDQRNFTAALASCHQVETNPGKRDLAQFLHQYGLALAGVGRYKDAAVMFTRCGVLFASSSHAAPSLIEAAIIHRDQLADVAAASRLLQRAIAVANDQNQHQAISRAQNELATLSTSDMP